MRANRMKESGACFVALTEVDCEHGSRIEWETSHRADIFKVFVAAVVVRSNPEDPFLPHSVGPSSVRRCDAHSDLTPCWPRVIVAAAEI